MYRSFVVEWITLFMWVVEDLEKEKVNIHVDSW